MKHAVLAPRIVDVRADDGSTSKKPLLVRDPETFEPLPEKGTRKPLNTHWIRRMTDGDVVDVGEPKKTAAKPAKED